MSEPRTPLFEKSGSFFKVDSAQGIAYGWAIVCEENGTPYFDLHGDHIPEDAMTAALADFAKNSRVGLDQHQGQKRGEHVFVFPVTKATAAGLGLATAKTGAIVGYKPDDPKDLDAIANGTRTGFSIGGFLMESDETEMGKQLAKSHASGGKKKGRVFRTFKIHEISLVDRPAQEGATVAVVKRAIARSFDFEKSVRLTSAVDGHQHIVWLDRITCDDYETTSYDRSEDSEDGHTHRVVVENGVVRLSMNAGHTHEIELPEGWMPKVPTPPPAPTATGVEVITASASSPCLTSQPTTASVKHEKENMMTEAEIAALNSRLAKAEKMVELTDAQKVYFARLSSNDQNSFLAKSAADRQTELDAAVVFKGSDGTLYFKNDDPRLVNAVKTNESLAKSLATNEELRKQAEAVDFSKSVIGSFQGDDATRVALSIAVSNIADETVRKSVVASLAAANAAFESLAKSTGHNVVDPGTPTDAEGAFYKGRDEFAKANNLSTASPADAAKVTKAFMQTPTGATLYKAFVNGATH